MTQATVTSAVPQRGAVGKARPWSSMHASLQFALKGQCGLPPTSFLPAAPSLQAISRPLFLHPFVSIPGPCPSSGTLQAGPPSQSPALSLPSAGVLPAGRFVASPRSHSCKKPLGWVVFTA